MLPSGISEKPLGHASSNFLNLKGAIKYVWVIKEGFVYTIVLLLPLKEAVASPKYIYKYPYSSK